MFTLRGGFAGLCALILVCGSAVALEQAVTTAAARADVTTNANDVGRDGWYSNQPGLTRATLSGGTFGQVFDANVTGSVYAQPIVSQGTLLVATEDNFIYGLDPQTGAQQWVRQYGTPFNASDIPCGDLAPHIGITGTPVVDPSTNIAYFTDKEYVAGSTTTARYLAHAIDVATGTEETGWPIVIQGASSTAPTQTFQPRTALQRPGLLLMNGVVYAAFGSQCGIAPYVGWIVGLSTTQHKITTMFSDIGTVGTTGGSIWQAGSGLVSDGANQILFATGNAGFTQTAPRAGNQPPTNLSESVVRATVQPDGTVKPVDFFTPYDAATLDANDLDFGSGGPVALPDAYFGVGTTHPHLLTIEGKQGYLYLLDRDNLGGFLQGAGGDDGVVGRIGPYGGVWGRAGVWPGDGGYVYYVTANTSGAQSAGSSGYLRAYKYGKDGTNKPTLSPAGQSFDTFGFGSGSPVVTSTGTTTGSSILWDVWMADGTGANAQLRAYNPVPVNGQMQLLWSAPIGTGSKFTSPVIDNSHVYVGTRDGHVRGFWSPVSLPLTASQPTFPTTALNTSSTQTLTFTAKSAVTVTALTSSDPTFTLGTPSKPLPANLAANATISVPVTFTPTHAGPAATTVRADTSLGPVDVGLNGLGQSATPLLQASPSILSMGGTTPHGQPLSDSITLSNAGAQPLTIDSIVPPANAQYSLSGLPANGSQLASGASITLGVTFTPGAANGEFDDQVTIHSHDGTDQVVMLTAVVAAPAHVTITPQAINLGSVPIGSTVDATFVLTNTGGLATSFSRSKPPGKHVGFAARTDLSEGSSIPPHTSTTEVVQFRATALGTFSDTWSLDAADGQGPRNVTFTAHVVPSGHTPVPNPTHWKLNGTAKFTASPSANSIQLTPPDQATVGGSAFLTKPVASRYVRATFDSWIGGGSGADGLALVFADASTTPATALGVNGGGLGFSGISGVGVALDTFADIADGNPSENFVGIADGPAAARNDRLHWVATNAAIPLLEEKHANPPMGYQRRHIAVQLANGLLTVSIDGVVVLDDVPVTVAPQVRLGFTGGSGGDFDEHTVVNPVITLAAPDTIVTARPAATTTTSVAHVSFTSPLAGSTFTCQLDAKTAAPCTSPKTVTVVRGAHTLTVRAVSPVGVPDPTPAVVHWTYAPPTSHGYWMLGSDGSVYSFGGAARLGGVNDPTTMHLTPTPTTHGYWVVNRAGHVTAFGDARNYGDAGPMPAPGEQVTTMSTTPTGNGYWLFTSAGRVFARGDARSFGDLSALALNQPIIDSIATPSGRGYYMVASDGGVFAFGDAHFHGSLGATVLNKPIIGLVPTSSGRGYWMDASDGGVFAFGDARFKGSLGATVLNRPIVGMATFGDGYLLAGSDGGIFDFSSSPYLNSLADTAIPAPIIGLAAFG